MSQGQHPPHLFVTANHCGSVEHFYHFFFSVLIPLLDLARRGKLVPGAVMRSCGPMNAILDELSRDGIHIDRVSREEEKRLFHSLPKEQISVLTSQECYDLEKKREERYDPAVLCPVAAWAKSRWLEPAEPIDALIIERASADEFHQSETSEVSGGGSNRRSIPNFEEVEEGLRTMFARVQRVQLEGMTLPEQISLFHRARILVAQHGAALSNLVWMREGTIVMEYCPVNLYRFDHYMELASPMGLVYNGIPQANSHSPVSVKLLLLMLSEITGPTAK